MGKTVNALEGAESHLGDTGVDLAEEVDSDEDGGGLLRRPPSETSPHCRGLSQTKDLAAVWSVPEREGTAMGGLPGDDSRRSAVAGRTGLAEQREVLQRLVAESSPGGDGSSMAGEGPRNSEHFGRGLLVEADTGGGDGGRQATAVKHIPLEAVLAEAVEEKGTDRRGGGLGRVFRQRIVKGV